jgi:CheY-like chemotaxis protein
MNGSPLLSYSELLQAAQQETPELNRPVPQTTIRQEGGNQAPAPVKRSLHVLCIDDDEQFLDMMKDCLTHFNHRVRVASGGKYGIELFCTAILKGEPYDVVITDLSMPDMDGCQVAQAIKAESPNTPVVMMTGANTKEASLMSTGVDVVIGKPPRLQELNDSLLRAAGSFPRFRH